MPCRFIAPCEPRDLQVTIVQGGDRILPELPREAGRIRPDSHGGAAASKSVSKRGPPPSRNRASSWKMEPRSRAGTVVCTIGNTTDPLIAGSGLPLEHGRIRTDSDMRVIGKGQCLGDRRLCPGAQRLRRAALADSGAVRRSAGAAARAKHRPAAPRVCRRARSVTAPWGCSPRSAGAMRWARCWDSRSTGFSPGFMWRGIYLAKMPTLARKVQIAFDWAWDLLFPRDICEISPRDTRRLSRAPFQHGEEIVRPSERENTTRGPR